MLNKTMSIEEDNNVVVDDSSSLEFVSFLGPGGFGYVSIMRDSKYLFCAEKSYLMDFLKILEKELRIMLCFRNHPCIVQITSPNLHVGINELKHFLQFNQSN